VAAWDFRSATRRERAFCGIMAEIVHDSAEHRAPRRERSAQLRSPSVSSLDSHSIAASGVWLVVGGTKNAPGCFEILGFRAAVLQGRIHLPPAASLQTISSAHRYQVHAEENIFGEHQKLLLDRI